MKQFIKTHWIPLSALIISVSIVLTMSLVTNHVLREASQQSPKPVIPVSQAWRGAQNLVRTAAAHAAEQAT